MKQGYTAIGVLIIVGVVLALGALFVLSESSNPTGYAGSPSGGVVAFVPSVEEYIPCSPENNNAECPEGETCQWYEGGYYCGNGCESTSCDFDSDCVNQNFPSNCCGGGTSFCNTLSNTCQCVGQCEEAAPCPGSSEGPNPTYCGGGECVSTDPLSDEGSAACDCNEDGCPEGAFCSQFGSIILSHPFVNPCGTGHCVIMGAEDGTLVGQCACEEKPCELVDAEGDEFDGLPDQCEDTVQCDEGSTCNSHDDCGGVGLGRCDDGICDCECVSWAPCDPDNNFDGNLNNDCGGYGEGGHFGQCIVGSDGAAECMCTDDLGCSPEDCIPGETPCSGASQDCGGSGGNCVSGICQECGVDCELPCLNEGCADGLTQAECDIVAQELGSTAGCKVDTENNECDCPDIPAEMCNACYSLPDGLVGNCV